MCTSYHSKTQSVTCAHRKCYSRISHHPVFSVSAQHASWGAPLRSSSRTSCSLQLAEKSLGKAAPLSSAREFRAERHRLYASASEKIQEAVSAETVIPGGKGGATHLKKGEVIRITNTHGTQVVDFWAFSTEKWGKEILSMHHTRNALCRTTPRAGDTLYTASMIPIVTFLEDSGPGVHDTTAAACSYGLYVLQIGEEAAKTHDSCTNNLYNALKELGYELAQDPRADYYTPAPFNLWMNVADEPDSRGYNWILPPKEQKAGDFVTFRAEQDVVVALSACPWDLGEMNGENGKPQDVSFQVFTS